MSRRLLASLLPVVCLLVLPATSWGAGFIGVQIKKDMDGKGLQVVEVLDGSPAAKAGVKAEDVITHLDGAAVGDLMSFVSAIRDKKAGDVVKLTVERGGKAEEIKVTVEDK
jgi:S1-C subfamily serine protease